MAPSDPLEGVKEIGGGLVAVALVVLVAFYLLGPIASTMGMTGAGGNVTTSEDIVGGSDQFGDSVDSVNFVRSSLNDSVRLTGAPDSNVTIDSDADLGNDLSACTWGALDSSVVTANDDGLLLATQQAVLWYNGTDDVYRGYYYNTSSRNSYVANVSASTPSSSTLVCLNHASQSLNISANTTTGTAVATGSSNSADYPANVSNWNGTVDETRLFATPLNGSQRSEWVATPGLAVNGSAPSTRVTYDVYGSSYGSTVPVYFSSGSASLGNATRATGFTAPSVTEGTDYALSGDTVTVLDGGVLEQDGEVLYIGYSASGFVGPFSSVLTSLANIGPAALSLLIIGLLAGAGMLAVSYMGESW